MNRVWTKIQRFSQESILKRHDCFPFLLKAVNLNHRLTCLRMRKLCRKITAGLHLKCPMTFSACQRADGCFSSYLLMTDLMWKWCSRSDRKSYGVIST